MQLTLILNDMEICLTKLAEVENPEVPDNIPVGHHVFGDFVQFPMVGYPFHIGPGWRTSMVVEILGFNTFKTRNSIYKITPVDQRYVNTREIPISVVNSGEPVLGRMDYHKKFMATELLNKLPLEDLDALFNTKVLDPFSPEGVNIMNDFGHPLSELYSRLESEEKVRVEMSLFISKGILER